MEPGRSADGGKKKLPIDAMVCCLTNGRGNLSDLKVMRVMRKKSYE